MRLSVKALAYSSGLVWGGGVLACGLLNLASPRYARGFLKVLRSVYPGYKYSRTLPDVLVGASYAVLDGAAAGALFGVLYNQCAARSASLEAKSEPAESPVVTTP
jgi:hypothetical protein